MPRPDHASAVAQAAEGVLASLTGLVRELQGMLSGAQPTVSVKTPGQRGPGKNNPVHIAAQRAIWARMTPAQKKARVAKMQAWRKKKKG